MQSSTLPDTLRAGGVAIVRTDTLYGMLALANDETAVRRVYSLKGRDDNKPPIVLIAEYSQLFDIPSDNVTAVLAEVWPGPVSVIMPSIAAPKWITRGGSTVAYRLPDNEKLRELIRSTGPLIAPSANPQGKAPARTTSEAKLYFGDLVDWYEEGGEVKDASPSKIIEVLPGGAIKQLR